MKYVDFVEWFIIIVGAPACIYFMFEKGWFQ